MALLMVRNPLDPNGGFYEFNVLSGKQGSSIYFGKIDETNNIYTEIGMPENWTVRVNDLILTENGSIWQITDTNTKSVSWVADALKGEQGIPGEKGDTGAKIISTELKGQDTDGGNIYVQTFDDGSTAEFTAPKGEQGLPGEKGDTYTLTDTDKTDIATITAPLVGTDLDTRITKNTNAITALQGKHIYMHMILFKWQNNEKTKSVHAIMTIINTSSTKYSIEDGTIGDDASRQKLLKDFRDGCLSVYPHECSGSFYGVPYTNIYSQQDGTFFITGIKKINNGTTGNDFIGIIADPLEKVAKTHEGTTYQPIVQAGETVMQIDYNTAGTVYISDNVVTLI